MSIVVVVKKDKDNWCDNISRWIEQASSYLKNIYSKIFK